MKIDFDFTTHSRDVLREAVNFIISRATWDPDGHIRKFQMFLQSTSNVFDVNIFEAVRLHDVLRSCIHNMSSVTGTASTLQVIALVECRMTIKFAINGVAYK